MTIEYIEISSSPYDEDCAQVGAVDYSDKSSKELAAYVNQLNRMFPDANSKGVKFRIKSFPHDFGTYWEVCIVWDSENPIADEYAYIIDQDLPSNWDEQAVKELNRI